MRMHPGRKLLIIHGSWSPCFLVVTFCQSLCESCHLARICLPHRRPSQARVSFVSSDLLSDRAGLRRSDRHPLPHAKETDGTKEIGINKTREVEFPWSSRGTPPSFQSRGF